MAAQRLRNRLMRLVLFEPDIPQNTGAFLRLSACLGLPLDIVEPCGFLFDDRRLRRVVMDYLEYAEMVRHESWSAYRRAASGRLLLLTTKGDIPYTEFEFRADDNLILGRESAGVPAEVHEAADARLVIPLRSGLRSINVALAGAMVISEALRQTNQFPGTAR